MIRPDRKRIADYLHKNRVFLCLFAFCLVFGVAAIIFTNFNYRFYGDVTVARITDITETYDHTEYSPDGERSEDHYRQDITARVVYGEEKGSSVSLENTRSESNVYDTHYYEGDELFLSREGGVWTISGVKRDVYVVAMVVFTALLLIAVGRRKGVFALISVVFNAAVFWFGIKGYVAGGNLLLICIGASVVFTVVCLTFIGGFTKMTAISIVSTLAGLVVTFGLACAVIYGLDFKGLYVEGLEYLIIATDYRVTFMAELLVGGLGAIMDISVSISSALCELKRKDQRITYRALMRSGREIGRDITGTMTNVLLFTYLCGGIPLMMVIVRSGVPMMKYIFGNNNLEIARFLVGSIGIVVTVPIACFVSAFLLSKKKAKKGGAL